MKKKIINILKWLDSIEIVLILRYKIIDKI